MLTKDNTLPQIITDDVKEGIQKLLSEMVNSMVRVECERELQKDIANRAKDEYNIPKNLFKKLAKIKYASNLAEEVAQTQEFFEFAEAVLEYKKGENS